LALTWHACHWTSRFGVGAAACAALRAIAGPRFPVIAVVHSFMVHGADGRSRDEVLGLPLCRIYERSAVGPLPPHAPAPPSPGVFARRALKIFGWWVLGFGRPSPLFDDRTNAPRAVPRVLTRSERAGLVKL
jgi:hypothetical protein